MEKLQQIIEGGKTLAERRTWLKKGFASLIEKINIELKNIPDMEENAIYSSPIREWEEEKHDYGFGHKIRVAIFFQNDAYMQLTHSYQIPSGEWKNDSLDDPSIFTIRTFAEKIEIVLNEFLKILRERNSVNQAAVEKIQMLLEKLEK